MSHFEVFGIVPIQPECSAADCDKDATFVYPILTRDRGLEIHWLCDDHAADMQQDRDELAKDLPASELAKNDIYPIERVCLFIENVTGIECGAYATLLVVGGMPNPDPHIATVSVCEKHAEYYRQ